MIHSDEKIRQMARSLLPSKHRKQSRKARKHIHRVARNEARQELAMWLRCNDLEADVPPCAPWEDTAIRQQVYWRQGGDKVNPFIRWATARTRHMPREARAGYIRGLLPRSVIGEHALGHLERTPAFEDPVKTAWRTRHWWRNEKSRKGALLDRGEHAQLLRAVLLEPEGHRTFNRYLRERYTLTVTMNDEAPANRKVAALPAHRPLLGVHDVNPFLDSAHGSHHRAWDTLPSPLHWVGWFLRRFKAHRRHLPALRAALEAEGLLKRAVPAPPRKAHAR
ncbi:hypothetical protein HPP05_24300 [Corallococcus exiguus]|uniref:hypothetical protein n=1 Tax=Corallococcus exiguus TaxID=83462 RepID=UPI0014949EE8|nr:hypothetical protein [Corallococcus exiguus]NPC72873.1 hypothetical protein [Corallococcus exiguus]NRD46552.1 hypothetical protein [Corallococcus exiguus]